MIGFLDLGPIDPGGGAFVVEAEQAPLHGLEEHGERPWRGGYRLASRVSPARVGRAGRCRGLCRKRNSARTFPA
jgi:hypothetical protein